MAEKLNLSARLDRARAEREAGLAPDPGRTHWDLRFHDEDGRAYEGRGLRTGEQLTAEQWTARSDVAELPTWTRRVREAQDGPLIDLTDRDASSAPTAARCPSCGHDVEIEHVDLDGDTTRLACGSCGRVWTGTPGTSAPLS